MFNQDSFNQFILQNNVIGFFETPITLKSGKNSHFYVNWRNVASDVYLIDQCANYLITYCEEHHLTPNCFYGVPEGATKLGIITQYKWAQKHQCSTGTHLLSMGRAKPKEHGDAKDKYFVGEPQGNIILLEDVTTTGDSMLNTLDQLCDMNKNVIACIGLTNRQSKYESHTVTEKVAQRNIPYFALSQAKELLQEKLTSSTLTDATKKEIQNEINTL